MCQGYEKFWACGSVTKTYDRCPFWPIRDRSLPDHGGPGCPRYKPEQDIKLYTGYTCLEADCRACDAERAALDEYQRREDEAIAREAQRRRRRRSVQGRGGGSGSRGGGRSGGRGGGGGSN